MDAAQRLDIPLTVASELPSTLEDREPGNFLTLDFRSPERAVEQTRRFHDANAVGAVFGVDDDTAVLAARLSEALGLTSISPAAAIAARDKFLQRTLLRAGGVPVPDFARYDLTVSAVDIAGRAPYPCVLKPVSLSASRGVIRADSPAELFRARERLAGILTHAGITGPDATRFLVESYLPGSEYALEGLVDHGRLIPLALFDKPDPLEGPFFEETIYLTPSGLPGAVQRELVDCVRRAVWALGIEWGPVHAELRYNGDGPWLIELAGRPIGGRCSGVLRFDGGCLDRPSSDLASLEEVHLAHAFGRLVEEPALEPEPSGVMMIPVPGAGALRAIRGVQEARQIGGVTDLVITAHLGQVLVPLPEGSRYPGFIFARGETRDAVERSLRDAHAALRFELEPVP